MNTKTETFIPIKPKALEVFPENGTKDRFFSEFFFTTLEVETSTETSGVQTKITNPTDKIVRTRIETQGRQTEAVIIKTFLAADREDKTTIVGTLETKNMPRMRAKHVYCLLVGYFRQVCIAPKSTQEN